MVICDAKICTGCGVCADACPHNCITMQYDANGFLKSCVDQTICKNCNRCISVCPANHPNNKNLIDKAYKVRRNDSSAILDSSSGGVAALLSEAIVKNSGAVCGCSFGEDLLLKHSIETTPSGIEKFKGSKYIQSNTSGIYKELKKTLELGKPVLFIGTPCQVSACNNFLNKEYSNLYTVDLICHGVASNKVLEKYKETFEGTDNRIINVKFREKKEGYDYNGRANLTFIFQNGEKKILDSSRGIVLWFAADLSLRESCYSCPFVSHKRCSDITLSDYVGDDFTPDDRKYGVSMVYLNTPKGEELFSSILKDACAEEKDAVACMQRYARLNNTKKPPRKRNVFFRDLDKLTLEELEQKYTLENILPSKAYRYAKAIIKRIKRFLGD